MTEELAPTGRDVRRWAGQPQAPSPDDLRTESQRDVDRIIYSRAWARLAGVTQVVTPTRVGPMTHNRMTHSLKVAQVGRTLALALEGSVDPWSNRGVAVDPMTVYAASLAHDLGHPPFGHIGEKQLNAWAEGKGLDGFEGNAQSFRILTRLEPRRRDRPGMDVTGATLNAVLKYPWLRLARDERDGHAAGPLELDPLYKLKREKWGAYNSDADSFRWARKSQAGLPDDRQTLEAAIMDTADDFTYALHDLDDFAQSRLIDPSEISFDARLSLRYDRDEIGVPGKSYGGSNPITRIGEKLQRDYPDLFDKAAWLESLSYFADAERWLRDPRTDDLEEVAALPHDPAEETPDEAGNQAGGSHWLLPPQNETRVRLREWTSHQLTVFSRALRLEDRQGWPHLAMEASEWHFMQILKGITRTYIVSRTDLSAIQFSQGRVLGTLCDDLLSWYETDPKRVPERLLLLTSRAYDFVQNEGIVENYREPKSKNTTSGAQRGVVDFVAELTDHQALELHRVLSGHGSTSMVDGILNIF